MNRRHPVFQLIRQIASAEMNILEGRFKTAVARELGNVMQFPASPGQVCEAQMAERVRRELVNTGPRRNPFDDL